MPATAITQKLEEDGLIRSGEVSEATVNRFVNRIKAELGQAPGKDMRRYERAHANDVWCGDSNVAPRLTEADAGHHH